MREETRGVSVSCLWTWQPFAVCVIDVLLTYFSESRHDALEHLSVFVSLLKKKSPLLLLHTVLNNISTFTSDKKMFSSGGLMIMSFNMITGIFR